MAPARRKESPKTLFRIAIAAIVILIVVAAVFLIFPFQAPSTDAEEENGEVTYVPPDENGEENGNGEENETEICDDDCLYERALAETEPKYCNWMENETLGEECYAAIAYDNLYACLNVSGEELHFDCIVWHADMTGDLSLCDKLDDEALECKRLLEPCYFYNGTELRTCLALKNDDPAYCENDSICLLDYSVDSNDSSLCNGIPSEAVRTACISVHEGQDKCTGLESVATKEYCWELYAIYTDNGLICTQITSESQYALECYSYFAIKNNDVHFCEAGFLELDDLWDCYTEYSLGSEDVAGCDLIDRLASTHMFNCYFEYGKKYGNAHACDMMDSIRFAKTCYPGVIMNNTNLNYEHCADVWEIEWKNKCYTESAKVYEDISICNYIEGELERKMCTESYHTFVNGESD